jgi:hypothetical protein
MSSPDYIASYSPGGLSFEDITVLQADVTAELRREGHLPPPRRHRRRSAATSRPRTAARPERPQSSRVSAAPDGQHREEQQ